MSNLKEFIKVSYDNKSKDETWDNLVFCECRDINRIGLFKIISLNPTLIELKCHRCKRFITVRIPFRCPNCNKIIKIKEATKDA